jgi:site-specific recombinase XerD
MPIRTDKRNIPVVALAVQLYIEKEKAARKKDIRNLISVLQGPEKRVHGKKAAGPALAKSELGQLRCDRVTDSDMRAWFLARHPEHLAPATVKRGMAAMRGFLNLCVRRRWMDELVLEACFSAPDSNPRREWLHPEQLDPISLLIEQSDEFDDYERFGFEMLRDLGVRPDEARRMRAHHLDPRTMTLTVVGKGRGEGKERGIPVDEQIVARWQAHISRMGIPRDGYMLFQRETRFVGGSTEEFEWIADKSRPMLSPKPLLRVMRKVSELAERELQPELVPHFQLTPTVMRRTFACTQLILHALGLGGMDVRTLQVSMGHERLDTTQRYMADVQEYINATKRHINTRDGARLIAEVRRKLDSNG